MKLLVLLSLFVLYSSSLVISQDIKSNGRIEILPAEKAELDKQWNMYKIKYNKTYKNESEEEFRRKIFEDKIKQINEHNDKFNTKLDLMDSSDPFSLGSDQKSSNDTFALGLNEESDLTPEEFFGQYLGFKAPSSSNNFSSSVEEEFSLGDAPIPESFDWRLVPGVLGKIKHQKGCGSCWTFSALSALEAQVKIKENRLVVLSEQSLLDCVYSDPNICNKGGWMWDAYEFIKINGASKNEFYPYTAVKGQCRHRPSFVGAKVTGYKIINYNRLNEEALRRAIFSIGPISISINVSPKNNPNITLPSFRYYKTGIYQDSECVIGSNHAVTAVGYGKENGKEYFIIRNSWGETWGEKGYMRIARNKNMCGVGLFALFPTV